LFGGEDVFEPGEDGLLRPVLNAYAAGHVIEKMVFDIDV
jgi:hypothetical protein